VDDAEGTIGRQKIAALDRCWLPRYSCAPRRCESHSQDPEDKGRPELYSRDNAKERRLNTERLDLPSFQRRRKKAKRESSMNEEKRQAKVCAQSRTLRFIFIRNRIRHFYPATDVQCQVRSPTTFSVAPRSQWRWGDARTEERISPDGDAANITRLHPPGIPRSICVPWNGDTQIGERDVSFCAS
jgi:hypothetical protein